MGNCLPLLFYIICGYTAEQSFEPLIFSYVSLFSMTFCYGRKLPSKVVSAGDNQPFLKRSQQNTIFHVIQFVLWRFNWILRDQDKLSYRFYWYKISLSVDILLLGIFFSCNLLILGYSPGIEQSRIICLQNYLKYLHKVGGFRDLSPLPISPPPPSNQSSGIKPASPKSHTLHHEPQLCWKRPSGVCWAMTHLHYFFQISWNLLYVVCKYIFCSIKN